MIRKTTIEKIILKFEGKFSAKEIYLSNRIIFDQKYSEKKSLSYITVVLHTLWKNKKIKKVGRGIFTNQEDYQEINFNDWNSMISFYCNDNNGFVAKEWLWNKHGLIEDYPKKLVIYTNLIQTPKKQGNIEIKPTKIVINAKTVKIFELYELIQVADFRNDKHYRIIDRFIVDNNLDFDEIKSYNQFFKRRFNKLIKNYDFK